MALSGDWECVHRSSSRNRAHSRSIRRCHKNLRKWLIRMIQLWKKGRKLGCCTYNFLHSTSPPHRHCSMSRSIRQSPYHSSPHMSCSKCPQSRLCAEPGVSHPILRDQGVDWRRGGGRVRRWSRGRGSRAKKPSP